MVAHACPLQVVCSGGLDSQRWVEIPPETHEGTSVVVAGLLDPAYLSTVHARPHVPDYLIFWRRGGERRPTAMGPFAHQLRRGKIWEDTLESSNMLTCQVAQEELLKTTPT